MWHQSVSQLYIYKYNKRVANSANTRDRFIHPTISKQHRTSSFKYHSLLSSKQVDAKIRSNNTSNIDIFAITLCQSRSQMMISYNFLASQVRRVLFNVFSYKDDFPRETTGDPLCPTWVRSIIQFIQIPFDDWKVLPIKFREESQERKLDKRSVKECEVVSRS